LECGAAGDEFGDVALAERVGGGDELADERICSASLHAEIVGQAGRLGMAEK
jgi:hypothetical protein